MLTEGLELIFVVIIALLVVHCLGYCSRYIYENFNDNKKWIGAGIDIFRITVIITIVLSAFDFWKNGGN